MINVPCSLPSIKPIAIALTNMPVMIHTMSISTIPVCIDSSPVATSATTQVLSVWLTVCSLSSLPYEYAQVNCNYEDYDPEYDV